MMKKIKLSFLTVLMVPHVVQAGVWDSVSRWFSSPILKEKALDFAGSTAVNAVNIAASNTKKVAVANSAVSENIASITVSTEDLITESLGEDVGQAVVESVEMPAINTKKLAAAALLAAGCYYGYQKYKLYSGAKSLLKVEWSTTVPSIREKRDKFRFFNWLKGSKPGAVIRFATANDIYGMIQNSGEWNKFKQDLIRDIKNQTVFVGRYEPAYLIKDGNLQLKLVLDVVRQEKQELGIYLDKLAHEISSGRNADQKNLWSTALSFIYNPNAKNVVKAAFMQSVNFPKEADFDNLGDLKISESEKNKFVNSAQLRLNSAQKKLAERYFEIAIALTRLVALEQLVSNKI